MVEFRTLPVVNDLTIRNSSIDSEFHLGPKGGKAHTRVEYSTIMKAPLRGGYKKGKRNQNRGWNKNWGETHERKGRTQFWE